MKTFILTILLSLTTTPFVFADEPIKLSLECMSTATKITGEKSSKQFRESFIIEKSVMPGKNKDGKIDNWGVSSTEFTSDGTKYNVTSVSITPEHVVTSFANVVGAGYNRKLLVFTFIIDMKAHDMERIVVSDPAGSDERTHAICKETNH